MARGGESYINFVSFFFLFCLNFHFEIVYDGASGGIIYTYVIFKNIVTGVLLYLSISSLIEHSVLSHVIHVRIYCYKYTCNHMRVCACMWTHLYKVYTIKKYRVGCRQCVCSLVMEDLGLPQVAK